MSTAYVVTTCCAAPVGLVDPSFECEAAHLVCARCGREAGSPGAEDSEDVEALLMHAPAIDYPWLQAAGLMCVQDREWLRTDMVPRWDGQLVYVVDERRHYRHDGQTWRPV
jgi:hypothetical protein